jgi:hypothetical protein
MTQIGNHDDAYLSTPLEEKLAWFQNAPGLSAVEPARRFMAGAAALYTDSDSQVRATMRNLGADWTGDAATTAGATLQRAADWSQGAGAGHSAAGQTVEGYGQSFESLRGQVHWDDPWAWGWRDTATAAASVATLDPGVFLGNLTTDYFTTAQQNRTNDASAVAALRAHEQQTRATVDSFPALAPAGIDPSGADPDVTKGGSHQGPGLPFAPVAPAGARDEAGAGVGIAAQAHGAVPNGAPGPFGTSSVPVGPAPIPGVPIAGGTGAGGPVAGAGAPGGLGEEGSAAPPGLPGGADNRATFPGGSASGVRGGDPAGRLPGASPLGGGTAEGTAGWREVVPRGTGEPGVVARGSATGGAFAGRLPSGSPETPPVGGRGGQAGMPFLGGMGGGAARSTEHRRAYWVRSSEPFDVPLPPHGDGLLQGSEG